MSKPYALVTGASSGIGFELAKQFATHGFDLFVTADDDRIVSAAEALRGLGADVAAVQADLRRFGDVEQVYEAARAGGREVDAAALNAGVTVNGHFAKTPLQDELDLISLNVASTVHLAKSLVRDMTERGEGRLLFTASIEARMPGPYQAVYAASKAFVHSFALAIRTELKDTGVSVTSLMPGLTDTDIFDRADMRDTAVGEAPKEDAATVAAQGFQALMDGRQEVVGGSLATKVGAAALNVLPPAISATAHAALSKPRSGEKD